MREAELDALPDDTSRAVRQLAEYNWRSRRGQTFEQIKDLLRSRGAGLAVPRHEAGAEQPRPAAMERIHEMMTALNDMLDADARGEHTQQDFDDFMRYGDFFPESPAIWMSSSTTWPAGGGGSAAAELPHAGQRDELAG